MQFKEPKKTQATRESAMAMYRMYQWMFGNPLPPFEDMLKDIIPEEKTPAYQYGTTRAVLTEATKQRLPHN
jgi:ribosomal protein S7